MDFNKHLENKLSKILSQLDILCSQAHSLNNENYETLNNLYTKIDLIVEKIEKQNEEKNNDQ